MLASDGARVLLAGCGKHTAESMLPSMPTVGQTIKDVGHCLIEQAGLDPAHLSELLDPADPIEFGAALMDTAEQATDILMIYYVGHGLRDDLGSELYLATQATMDLNHGIPTNQALSYAALARALKQSRARLVMVVLDCCYAGLAQTAIHPWMSQVFDSTRYGSYLLAATGPNGSASAPWDTQHTAFSGALITLLAEGDPTAGPYLSLNDLHLSLSRILRNKGLPIPYPQIKGQLGQHFLSINPAYSGVNRERNRSLVDESPTGRSPYLGLTRFSQEDSRFFFGRDELTARLIERVKNQMSWREPLMVVGPSGVGKSSLLWAGLVPALERSHTTEVVGFTPSSDPVGALARRFAPLGGCSADELQERLLDEPGQLADLLTGRGHLVIIVDQFEELFTLCHEERQRQAFLTALHKACWAAVVVIGVRADFEPRCMDYDQLITPLEHRTVVPPMASGQLRQVIEEPARVAGLEIEPGLTNRLLEDIGVDMRDRSPATVLPLLSHALLATWQLREHNLLTVAGYVETGGIRHALAKTADTTLESLDQAAQQAARQLLPRLVQIGEGADDARARISLADLTPLGDESDPRWRALDRFIKARLLTVDNDTVEISHEALIRAWPRLGEWIAANRAILLTLQQLDRQAREWVDHGEDPSYLYSGLRLANAEDARTQWETEPTAYTPLPKSSERFLLSSIHARKQALRARRRRVAVIVASLTLSLLITMGVAIDALRDADNADRQRLYTLSQSVARQSIEVADIDPELSRLLAAAAYRLSKTLAAEAGLARAAIDPRRAVLPTSGDKVSAMVMGQIERDPVLIAGTFMGGQSRIEIWNAADGTPLRYMDIHGGVTSLATGEIERRAVIVAGSRVSAGSTKLNKAAGQIDIWNAADGAHLYRIHTGYPVSAVAVGSFNGKPVIISGSISEDAPPYFSNIGRLEVWDARDGTRLFRMNTKSPISAIALTTFKGKPAIISGGDIKDVLAGDGNDGRIEIWDTTAGTLLGRIDLDEGVSKLTTGEINGSLVMISAGATDEGKGQIKLWDTKTGNLLKRIATSRPISAISLGKANGDPLIISGDDSLGSGGVEIWDAISGTRLDQMPAYSNVSAVAIGQFGGRLSILSASSKVEIWDQIHGAMQSRIMFDHQVSTATTGRFNGKPVIISGSSSLVDGERIAIFDAANGASLRRIRTSNPISAIATGEFAGRSVIISGSNNDVGVNRGAIEVWDARNGALLYSMTADGGVYSLTIGQFEGKPAIISGSSRGKIEIWSAYDGARLRQIDADGPVLAMAVGVFQGKPAIISGSGSSNRGLLEVWSAVDGTRLHQIDVGGEVLAVSMGEFNGKPVIISGNGREGIGWVEVWDATHGARLVQMNAGHPVSALAKGQFNGRPVIISGSDDGGDGGAVDLWDAANGALLYRVKTHGGVSSVMMGRFQGRPVIISSSNRVTSGGLEFWDLSLSSSLFHSVCARTSRSLTREEWRSYIGSSEAFMQACPL
ncbi:hypothetical protein AB0392_12310 [Nonomuraea angiospora]|uniref:caspase, EACC1-associated type n=1 Tax=Nonomuraea angiospora TaxID=46172 RepID=UPI00344FC91B